MLDSDLDALHSTDGTSGKALGKTSKHHSLSSSDAASGLWPKAERLIPEFSRSGFGKLIARNIRAVNKEGKYCLLLSRFVLGKRRNPAFGFGNLVAGHIFLNFVTADNGIGLALPGC